MGGVSHFDVYSGKETILAIPVRNADMARLKLTVSQKRELKTGLMNNGHFLLNSGLQGP